MEVSTCKIALIYQFQAIVQQNTGANFNKLEDFLPLFFTG